MSGDKAKTEAHIARIPIAELESEEKRSEWIQRAREFKPERQSASDAELREVDDGTTMLPLEVCVRVFWLPKVVFFPYTCVCVCVRAISVQAFIWMSVPFLFGLTFFFF